jgi:hypothetical protein
VASNLCFGGWHGGRKGLVMDRQVIKVLGNAKGCCVVYRGNGTRPYDLHGDACTLTENA